MSMGPRWSGINRSIVNCSKGPPPLATSRLDFALGSVPLSPNPLRRPKHIERPGAGPEEEEPDQADNPPWRRQEPVGNPPERKPDAERRDHLDADAEAEPEPARRRSI